MQIHAKPVCPGRDFFLTRSFLRPHFRFNSRLGSRCFFRSGRYLSGQEFLEGQSRVFRSGGFELDHVRSILRSVTTLDDKIGKMRTRVPTHVLVDVLGKPIHIDFDAHGILQEGNGPSAFRVFRPEPFAVDGMDGEVLDANGHVDLDLVDVIGQSAVHLNGPVLVVHDVDQFGSLKFQHFR